MKTLKIAVLCAICGEVAAILFMLTMSFFLAGNEDPTKNVPLISGCAVGLFSFIAGAIAGFFEKDRPILCGALCGVCLMLLSLLLSFIPGGKKELWQSLVSLLLTLALPAVSSFIVYKLDSNRSVKRRKHYRKRR